MGNQLAKVLRSTSTIKSWTLFAIVEPVMFGSLFLEPIQPLAFKLSFRQVELQRPARIIDVSNIATVRMLPVVIT